MLVIEVLVGFEPTKPVKRSLARGLGLTTSLQHQGTRSPKRGCPFVFRRPRLQVKANYVKYTTYSGIDCINNPQIVVYNFIRFLFVIEIARFGWIKYQLLRHITYPHVVPTASPSC